VRPLPSVNELSAFTLSVAPRAQDGSALAATTISYRVDCLTSRENVVPLTAATVTDGGATITVPADANRILRDRHEYEVREITVVIDAGLTTERTETTRYEVVNVYGRP
jgi:hypothetical protein